MKKIIAVILLMTSLSVLRADQLQVMSLSEAETVVNYFDSKHINEVVLYFFEDNPYLYVKNVELEIVKIEGRNERYEIQLTGEDVEGHFVEHTIDLAYLYIKKGASKGVCLGNVLNYDVEPEVKSFDWANAVAKSRIFEAKKPKEKVQEEKDVNLDNGQDLIKDATKGFNNSELIYWLVAAALIGVFYIVKYQIKKNKEAKEIDKAA
jgi:hypothetical protein